MKENNTMLSREQTEMNSIIEDAETVVCAECGSKMFTEVYFLKRVSALMSPTGQEVKIPVATFRCADCGSINKDFLPPSLSQELLDEVAKET
jgi:DNA-directed RNA polymerase subunit RPC12/RpoP